VTSWWSPKCHPRLRSRPWTRAAAVVSLLHRVRCSHVRASWHRNEDGGVDHTRVHGRHAHVSARRRVLACARRQSVSTITATRESETRMSRAYRPRGHESNIADARRSRRPIGQRIIMPAIALTTSEARARPRAAQLVDEARSRRPCHAERCPRRSARRCAAHDRHRDEAGLRVLRDLVELGRREAGVERRHRHAAAAKLEVERLGEEEHVALSPRTP